ncbi:MAG: hypothetical protein DRQ88_08350 [Epsilonproteobacteria bacterium]|nr:MAG: hypothetical protein DRQ89_06700 [Campylobacterota bacterium]RLA65939.1 MAG: hypothetical protein DRQ88_08350 [Campylobacterota bacterium]
MGRKDKKIFSFDHSFVKTLQPRIFKEVLILKSMIRLNFVSAFVFHLYPFSCVASLHYYS